MKIDWKFVSQTEGYQSLKASVNRDKMRWPGSEVKRMEGFFRRAIQNCHAISEHTGIPIDIILSWAEHNRDHWYANYYNNTLLKHVGCKDFVTKGKRLHATSLRGKLKEEKNRKWRPHSTTPDDFKREKARKIDIIRRHQKSVSK